jgi:DNA repair protein RecN (Recombination protein N)
VVCVTHLPQIAAFADLHVKIGKRVDGGRTRSTIAPLDESGSAAEIAAMAVGDSVDAEALAEARRLIGLARQTKGP